MRPAKRYCSFVCFLLFSFPIAVLAQPSAPRVQADKPDYVPGRILVKFRPNIAAQRLRHAHLAVAADVVDSFESVEGLQLVQIPVTSKLSQAIAAYRANPDVVYAEPDYVVRSFQTPNDPLFPNLWSLLNTGQNGGTPGADIQATQAWNITTGNSSVVIAVIDTGVDYKHPDLAARIFTGPICSGGVICHGINTVQGSGLDANDPFDDNGHGTHVSGTIGAIGNNALGVTGINWNVTILPCKFLGFDGTGDVAAAIKCLDFIKGLKDGGMNIVASNNSWGGSSFSQSLQDAIDRQRQSGILFIAAAGNDFADNDVKPTYPASFSLPNIISVAATDRNDHRAFFSNIGQHTVHIGAPGQEILSTLPGGAYGVESGTSMATPHVTGVAALLAAQDPTRDWRSIKNLILAGGDSNADLTRTISGHRLNALGSLSCLNNQVTSRLAPVTDIVSGSAGVPITLSAININCAQPNGPVQVSVSPGGQIIQLRDDGVAPDLSAADGVYTAAFVPATPGVYTLSFSSGDVVTAQVLQNYQAANVAANYRTIAGASLDLTDDGVAELISPFTIPFGGGSFSHLWISANGTISFSSAFSSYLHEFIPTVSPFFPPPVAAADTLVAPFWDDLLPLKGTQQNVFWQVTGSAPNRELVVEWRDVKAFQCRTELGTVKFQAVFFESSSDVLFNYSDAVFGGGCVDHDRGSQASIGLQVAPQLGTLWGFDGQSVNDGMSILWQVSLVTPPPPPTPVINSLSPAAVEAFGPDFTLTINGANFLPGARAVISGGFDRVTTFVSSSQLNVLIPASDIDLFRFFTNTVFMGVRNPGGTFDVSPNSPSYTINNPANPIINSVSPTSASADSLSFILSIDGANFSPFSIFKWNGQPITVFSINRTHLEVVIPGSFVTATSSAQLQVINPAPGGGSSAIVNYTIDVPSAVNALFSGKPFFLQFSSTAPFSIVGASRGPGSRPARFLGWNYARQQGPEFLRHFIRPYGALFTVTSSEKQSASAPGTAAIGAALTGALPGLLLDDTTPAGFLPTSVAVGDFNRDGHIDYVVSNGGSNDLWLYLGNGDGSFQAPRIIRLSGQTPVQVVTADLRGNGSLDLILAEPDSISVGVLLGNGDGTFGQETIYFAPGPVFSVAAADLNGDGHIDVVAGLLGTNDVGPLAFFAGDGTGKLSAPVFSPTNDRFAVPWVTTQIAVADFNGDGLPDLVVTDEGPNSPGIITFQNAGDGRFKKSGQLLFSDPFEFFINAVAGDLNHDGCPDIVAVDDLGLSFSALGNCDGTFHAGPLPGAYGNGDVMAGLALADVNGDGNLDLIASGAHLLQGVGGGFGQESGSLISVALGDGTGAFATPQLFRTQVGMFAVAVADLNGDLRPDIIAPSQDTDSVTVLLNDGTGKFGGPYGNYVGWFQKGSPFSGTLNAPLAGYVIDVNGDGKPDLLFADFGRGLTLPVNASVSLNDGTGHFLPDIKSPIIDGTLQFGGVAAGDFRSTGRPDLLVIPSVFSPSLNGSFFNFVPNTGAGHFGRPITIPLTHTPGPMAVGDFNGDGKLDFVMARIGGAGLQLDAFLGNGDGTFITGATQPFDGINPPDALFVGDFNGDGKLDVLVPINNPGSMLIEFLGNGDGTFAQGRIVISGPPPGTGVASAYFGVVDLNHDGRPDVVERNPAFFAPFTPEFKIFICQPDGRFVLGNTYAPYSGNNIVPFGASLQFTSSFVADFNGDGDADIAAFQTDLVHGNYLQIMLGNGDGTFTPTFERFPLGKNNFAFPTIATDLNGDGIADLLEIDGFTSAFNIITGAPGKPFSAQFVSLPVIGNTGTVRVSLSIPTASDTTLQLSASDPGISIPASITIPAGSLSQDVTLQVLPTFDNTRTFFATASDGVTSARALGTVAAPGNSLGFVLAISNPPFAAILPGQTLDLGFGVGSRGGYQTTVTAGCSGLPAGASCRFGSTTLEVPPGGQAATSLLAVLPDTLAVGDYTFNVVASDVALSQSLPVTFHVGDFGINIFNTSGPALSTGQATFRFELPSINNFLGTVIVSCSGLPAAASCPATGSNGGGAQDFAIITSNLAVGNYPFTITGTAGSISHSAGAILHVGDFGAATISPATATLNVGQSATFALAVNSVNGFVDPVSFLCNPTVNGKATNGVACSFSPATFDASGKLVSQLTVRIAARPAAAVVSTVTSVRYFWLPPVVALVLIPLLGGRRTRKMRVVLGCICLVTLISLVACGGGGGSGTPPPPPPTPTPTPQPQTVKVDVIGIDNVQPQAQPRTLTSFTITVQ